jgi:alpha-beta hydrolase superfamily lysophospholipase
MAHGWMDMSASFQFVVDALQGDWHVIAHDWRGFGLSERTGAGHLLVPRLLADLEACSSIIRRMRRSTCSGTAWAATSSACMRACVRSASRA